MLTVFLFVLCTGNINIHVPITTTTSETASTSPTKTTTAEFSVPTPFPKTPTLLTSTVRPPVTKPVNVHIPTIPPTLKSKPPVSTYQTPGFKIPTPRHIGHIIQRPSTIATSLTSATEKPLLDNVINNANGVVSSPHFHGETTPDTDNGTASLSTSIPTNVPHLDRAHVDVKEDRNEPTDLEKLLVASAQFSPDTFRHEDNYMLSSLTGVTVNNDLSSSQSVHPSNRPIVGFFGNFKTGISNNQ